MKQSKSKPKSAPKRVLRLPDLDHTKLSVLNTLGSPQSQRVYGIAFNKTVVLRYRIQLEAKHLAPATINLRLAAVRRLAYEAATLDCSARTWRLAFTASEAQSVWACGWGTGSAQDKRKTCSVVQAESR